MGGSSSQVVGYRYYAKFAAFIGNRIEKLIAINFDNRGWITRRPENPEPNLAVFAPNLYGENEGGVDGLIDVFIGYPNQQPSEVYQQYFPLVSGYPYQSYLVFHGGSDNKGFYLGNSGYMKEMLLWVKRTRVRNDGRGQWYEVRGDGAVVCEMGGISIDASTLINDAVTGRHTVTIRTSVEGSPTQPSYPEYTEYYNFPVISGGLNYSDGNATSIKITVGDGYLPGIYQFLGYVQYTTSNDLQPIDVIGGSIVEFESEKVGNTRFNFEIKAFVAGEFGLNFSLPERGAIVNFSIVQVQQGTFFLNTEGFDINPIHKIREILTDDTAMGKPETDVNDINFMKAADRIWGEKLGISWAIDEKSCVEAIEELCYHIEAGIRVNRQTGLYEMVLFRDDWFAENEIHTIAENKIKNLSLEVMNSDDIVNQLNVTYYDRERIKNSTFSVYENGSILTMGHANAESIDFPYFMNMRNAEIVANWKLKQLSTPAWSGSFATGWKEARKWNRYDLIRLPWSKKWNGTILARIMKINLGNGANNTVTIDFEEVIPYSGEMNTSIVVDAPVDSGPQPPQPSANAIFEAPYYLTVLRAGQTNADLELSNNPDIGYVAAIAAKPQSNSLNALLYTDGGMGEFEQVSRLDYCDILQLDQSITETTSAFVVTGSLTQTENSNNLILLNDELMGFVSFDNETKVLTVKRGALDTIPKKHNSGNLFVFDLPDVAFDSTQYADGEIVEAEVLTTTPSGIQDLSETGETVEIQARAIRPYPPANVKINGEYWLSEFTGNLELTWSHRNRLQQTGGVPLGWYEPSITLEPNVEYVLELYDADGILISNENIGAVDNYVVDYSNITTGRFTLKLFSERGIYKSLQAFEVSLLSTIYLAKPENLTSEYMDLYRPEQLKAEFDNV